MVEYRSFEDPQINETFSCDRCEVSIIVPTYHRENSFPHVIESIANQLANVLSDDISLLKSEIIIVVNWDEWEDSSAVKIANKLIEDYRDQIIKFQYPKEEWETSVYKKDENMPFMGPIKVVRYSEKLGKMAAMQKWAELAKGKVVAFVDADLKFPSDKRFLLQELIKPVLTEKVKLSIASLGANKGNSWFFAKWLSWQRALNRDEFIKFVKWLQKQWIGGYGIETALTLIVSKLFGKDQIKVIEWEWVWQLTKVHKDPFAAPISYVKMRYSVLKTRFKVGRLLNKNSKEINELKDEIYS